MLAILGLIAGIVIGILLQPSVPRELQPYLPIAIVAALDALFGGARAYLERKFSDKVFVVSFFTVHATDFHRPWKSTLSQ